ncbi:glycosyltransferase family 4 protein [Cohnella nanjingensis]|uniref:Glycosyltransferase family 4 protein n=1 Tax=Cohnella nanjingensis TaxID=1387779 RepID=A0A7X0RQJ3_9BACL|nr:glycosyltransferase family 4 protein [Cohnella nanjingensis]MBB6671720.1 glycosyltransferase family 4 protein [Cohnella nanjingensis]
MKVAIVHDWLVVYAGAEKVLEQLLLLYPDADLFSIVDFLPDQHRHFICHKPVRTSFIQNLPFARTKFRHYLALMPLAIEQFNLAGYDLILSSSYAVAKGVITGPDQLHISYVHTPIRYAWDLQHQYLNESGLTRGLKGGAAKWMLHRMRMWDARTANGVNAIVANSRYIARRIWKVYRREATVIYPPVHVDQFTLCDRKEDYYLTASRMVPYKKIDLIVEAFSAMPDKKLIVIGDGPEFAKIKAKAKPNVTLLGYQPAETLRRHMQQARAFVFAAEEDFGIAPVEAQSCGTPVIAYAKGGALETVRGLDREEPTGVFFERQTAEALIGAVEAFETNEHRIQYRSCRANAMRFSDAEFRERFARYVDDQIVKFTLNGGDGSYEYEDVKSQAAVGSSRYR